MFFKKLQRYNQNSKFKKMLKIIRIKDITNKLMNTLHMRFQKFNIQNLTNRNTILMLLKITVKQFNELMFKQYCNNVFYEHVTINKKQNKKLKNNNYFKQFKKKINFFKLITIMQEAKVMFLNNSKIEQSIFNNICKLITKINENNYFVVTFFKTNKIKKCV